MAFLSTVLIGWMRLIITEAIKDWYIKHSLSTTSPLLLDSCTSEDAGPSPVFCHRSRGHQRCLDHLSGSEGRGGNAAASESREKLAAINYPTLVLFVL